MNPAFLIKRSDNSYVITYSLVDDNSAVINLTNATVQFNAGNDTQIVVSKPAVITNALSGEVTVTLLAADTLFSGLYNAEFVVTFQDGTVLSYPRSGYISLNIQRNVDPTQLSMLPDGTSPLEVLNARGGYSDLNSRLGNTDTLLAEKAKQTDLSSISLIVRSSGSDDTTNINNAINTVSSNGGGTVLLPDSNYSALNIQLKSNVALVANQTTITKNGGDLTTNVIQSTGTVTGTPTPLSADTSLNSISVTVSSSTGFNVGDYVLVRDGNYIYSNGGRNQEILRIVSSTSTTITFSSPLIGSYTVASSAEIVKISPIVGASVKGIIMNIPQGTSGGGFYGTLNIGVNIEHCTTLRPYELPAFGFEQSSYCYVKNCISKDGQDIATGGHGYGIAINNSTHCFAVECYSERVRENPITYRSRYCGFLKCIDKYPGDDSFNTHGTGNSYIYIKGNWSIGAPAMGIVVGFSTHRAGDSNIFIEDNWIINAGSYPININSPTTGLLNNTYIKVKNNKVYNFGSSGVQGYGISVSYTDNLLIEGNTIDGQNYSQSLYAMQTLNCTKVKIIGNDILNIPSYGILYSSCTDVTIERNTLTNVFSYGIRSLNTNTNIRVRHNTSDKNVFSFTADVREANIWGTKRDRDKGATSVADGGTIAHNCAASPTSIRVTGSVASQMVSVTAVSATNFTVAIKTDAGVAGTTQTIYWEAEV